MKLNKRQQGARAVTFDKQKKRQSDSEIRTSALAYGTKQGSATGINKTTFTAFDVGHHDSLFAICLNAVESLRANVLVEDSSAVC